ncbi:MAG: triphosphoribosyl-dephospho-CoA synthase CitG [Oscillospiraceae bacterium]|nr:triphosphoribosyl-dephospho-CoA synthase CitG [Oscillospiraceae bacterium]
MEEVSLQEILLARETRAEKQKELQKKYSCPLICFTMNIAGPVKTSPLICRAFDEGVAMLTPRLLGCQINHREILYHKTGCEAYFSVDADPQMLKNICTRIEEETGLGRLFDMDIIDKDGTKLTRDTQRGCIVCGKEGRYCAASRAHDVATLQRVTNEMIQDHFAKKDSAHVADLAVQALLDEVHTTPKPGLVDLNNCGSHTDMDVVSFEKSAHALRPYFVDCVNIGIQTANLPPQEAFAVLRQRGLQAEKEMYAATGGVNTHKGAVFSMGILCCSYGRLWKAENQHISVSDIADVASAMTRGTMENDYLQMQGKADTVGQRLLNQYRITGARGEAADGFPGVFCIGLPAYKQALQAGLSPNDAAAVALLALISRVADANLYKRGGMEGAEFAKERANTLMKAFPHIDMSEIEKLDREFIERNLSPGGCADLLALTLFVHSLQKLEGDRNEK